MKNLMKCLGLSTVLIVFFGGCSSSSGTASSSASSAASASSAYPTGLAATSPFGLSSSLAKVTGSNPEPRYAVSSASFTATTATLTSLITATSSSLCTFDPAAFLTTVTDAGCYGPQISYEDHPDDSAAGGAGNLPPGDVGMWVATDSSSGNGCAAAQMNARLSGVEKWSNAALSGVGTMLCVISTDSALSIPISTISGSVASVDLTSSMPAVTGVSYDSATLNHTLLASGEGKYSYDLTFTYTPTGSATSNKIIVKMSHIPGGSSIYRGKLTWQVNTTNSGGNCLVLSTGSATSRLGSLIYNSASSTSLGVEVRTGEFCGHDKSGGFDSSGALDPSDKLASGTNEDGWGNTFDIFTASFNPSTLTGSYVYSWQAGPQDNNTRVFNVVTSEDSDDATEDLSGTAFFGYGNDIATSDPGNIKGYICNWGGPGSNHTLVDFVQKQVVAYNSASKKFDSSSANLTYAPTVSCGYDGSTGSTTFKYDTDGDGSLADETVAPVTHSLLSVTDGDSDGIFDEISSSGFSAPSAPSCSDC